jgi:hypothetical protein
VRESFTRVSFPHYWYYDVLRALDYWRAFTWDPRLDEALDLVHRKRRHGTPARPGSTWSDPATPSRWNNTLRVLRVIDWTQRVSG